MTEGNSIRFTPEDQVIALSKCSPQVQLEVKCQLLIDRVSEQQETIAKLQETIDRMGRGDEG